MSAPVQVQADDKAEDEDTTDQSTATGSPGGKPSDGQNPPEYVAPDESEWKRTQGALKKANEEAKAARLKLREVQQQHEDADGKAAREASEAAQAKLKPVAVRAAARAEFLAAGLADATPEQVSKLLRLVDMDAVEIADDGSIVGLDEQVAGVKADFPLLFGAKQRTTRISPAGREASGGNAKKTSGEIHAERLFGMGQTA